MLKDVSGCFEILDLEKQAPSDYEPILLFFAFAVKFKKKTEKGVKWRVVLRTVKERKVA